MNVASIKAPAYSLTSRPLAAPLSGPRAQAAAEASVNPLADVHHGRHEATQRPELRTEATSHNGNESLAPDEFSAEERARFRSSSADVPAAPQPTEPDRNAVGPYVREGGPYASPTDSESSPYVFGSEVSQRGTVAGEDPAASTQASRTSAAV